MKRIIAESNNSRGGLDDDYTLYDNGEVLHKYDRHIYRGGQDRKELISVTALSAVIKQKLLQAASADDKLLVERLMKIDDQGENSSGEG